MFCFTAPVTKGVRVQLYDLFQIIETNLVTFTGLSFIDPVLSSVIEPFWVLEIWITVIFVVRG